MRGGDTWLTLEESALATRLAFVELWAKDSLTAGLNRAVAKLRAFGNSVKALGQTMVGLGLTTAIPLGLAVKRFADFDDKMRTVRAVTSATAADMEILTGTAKELGLVSGFTAVQVADLMGELGKAGFSASQINTATTSVLHLARATGTDATLSAKIMVTTLTQFGLAADQAARTADALTVAANASLSSVESLGDALSYAGPVARDFGMSMEDTLAVLGTLGNIGIQGTNAGTALRRMLVITGAEAARVQEIFGVMAVDAAGNARPLVDTLADIGTATAGLGSAARAQKFNELFGLLGITGATGLTRSIGNVRELQAAIMGAGGAARNAATMMDAGIGGSIRKVLASIEGFAIAVGDSLAPVLQLIGPLLSVGLHGFKNWVSNNRLLVTIIATSALGLLVFGAALIGVGMAFKLAAFGLSVFSGAVVFAKLMFAGLMFVLVAGIALLKLYFGTLFGLFVILPFDVLKTFILNTAVQTSGLLQTLGQGFRAIGEIATTTFSGIAEAVKAGDMEGAFDIACAGVQSVWETLIATIRIAWRDFSGFFIDVWQAVVTKVAVLIDNLSRTFQAILNQINGSTAEGLERMQQQAARDQQLVQRINEHRAQSLPQNLRAQQEQALSEVQAAGELLRQSPINQAVEIRYRAAAARLRTVEARVAAYRVANPNQFRDEDLPDDLRQQLAQMRMRQGLNSNSSLEPAIQAQADREQTAREALRLAENTADRARIAAARTQLQTVIDQGATARSLAEYENAAYGTGGAGTGGAAINPAAALAAAGGKIETKGTFSAFAAGGLGASSVTERLLGQIVNNTNGLPGLAIPALE